MFRKHKGYEKYKLFIVKEQIGVNIMNEFLESHDSYITYHSDDLHYIVRYEP